MCSLFRGVQRATRTSFGVSAAGDLVQNLEIKEMSFLARKVESGNSPDAASLRMVELAPFVYLTWNKLAGSLVDD